MKVKEAEETMPPEAGVGDGELPNKYKGAAYARRVSSGDLLYNIVPTVSNVMLHN